MATLQEIRQQYPEYKDLSDMELARGLHAKHYSDMEFGTFARKIGMFDEPAVTGVSDYNALQSKRAGGVGPMLTQPIEYRTALEGAGKFFTDMKLGAQQLARLHPMIPDKPALYREAETKRETDAPLMATGAGQAGYVGAGVLSTLPVAAIPGAASVPGSAVLGGGLGALQPTATDGERILNTAAGAALGGAVPLVANKALALLSKPLAPMRPPAAAGGSVGASASAAGSMSAQASPSLQSAVARVEARQPLGTEGLETLKRYVDADTLPVPIRITRGQATRDPVAVSDERNIRGAATQYADLFKEQHEGLIKNLGALREEVGPNVFSTNAVEHGDTLIAAYKRIDDAAEAQIGALYKELRDALGSQVPIDAQRILSNTRNALRNDLMTDHAPASVMKSLEELAEAKNMTFENFESLRTQLARIQRSATADGNAKHAASIIRTQLEELPLAAGSGAERMKPIADRARAAARARFKALEADPAYEAAVNGTVPPDRFVQKFVVGGTRDDVARMRQAFANDPTAVETMGTAAYDHLRNTAGVDAFGNGAFSQARFNKQLAALDPKMHDLFSPQTAERLRQFGRVARTIQEEVPGSFVNRSNTAVAQLGTAAARTAEGVANVAANGIPIGTGGRMLIERLTSGRRFKQSLDPYYGLSRQPRKPPGGVMN